MEEKCHFGDGVDGGGAGCDEGFVDGVEGDAGGIVSRGVG